MIDESTFSFVCLYGEFTMDFDVVVYNQFKAVMRRNRLMPPVFTNITAHPTLNSNLQPPVVGAVRRVIGFIMKSKWCEENLYYKILVPNNTSPLTKLVPKSQVECRGRVGWVPQQCFSIGGSKNPFFFYKGSGRDANTLIFAFRPFLVRNGIVQWAN